MLLIIIYSCKESSNPITTIDNNFIYPLNIGNQWTYNASSIYSNVSPDSLKNALHDESIDLSVTIIGDTMLNSIKVYRMKEGSNKYPSHNGFYYNGGDGFYKYGYDNGGSIVLPKTKITRRFRFKGISFNNIMEFINQEIENIHLSRIMKDTIIYYERPRLIYPYPLYTGREWIYSPNIIKITKEVVGKENIRTKIGIFECYKILCKYDFNSDGIYDDDFYYYEYISSKGLIKTEIMMDNITITSIDHPDSVGHADLQYIRILTGCNF
jgi:hypothetical protein